MHRHTIRTTTYATKVSVEIMRMGLKMNIAKTHVMVVDNTAINVNNVLIEDIDGYVIGTTQQPQGKEPGQRDTTKNRDEESWQAGRHTPNIWLSPKATLSSV